MIYLISDSEGCAETNDPKIAAVLVRVGGYRECSKAEYDQKVREIDAADARAAEQERAS